MTMAVQAVQPESAMRALVATACLMLMVSQVASPPPSGSASAVNASTKQLMVDVSLFDEIAGRVAVVINRLTKVGDQPLILPDQPWEKSFDMYNAVIQGPDRVVRVYYGTGYQQTETGSRVAVATSADGVTFSKPGLGHLRVNSSDTNMLAGYVGDCVWEDPQAQLGGRYVSQGSTGHALRFSVSNDGLSDWRTVTNWSACNHPNSTCGSYTRSIKDSRCIPADGTLFWSCPGADSQSVFFYDHRLQEYTLFTRSWVGVHGLGTAYRAIRRLSTKKLETDCLSPDGPNRVDPAGRPQLCLGNDTIVMAPDELDNTSHPTDPHSAPAKDYYGATVWQYPGVADGSVYFMFPERAWHFVGVGNTGPMPMPAEIDVGLAVSRDGLNFSHIPGRAPLLPLGRDGMFDSRMAWVLPQPVIRDDKIFVYYAGSSHNHNGIPDPATPAYLSRGGISVAFARLDGFTSLDTAVSSSGSATATVTTKVLTFDAGGCINPRPTKLCAAHLQLNLDTGTNGEVKVALLDGATGQPLPGLSLADAIPFVGTNSVRAVANWTIGADVSGLRGKQLRVQIEMQGTKLYSLQFVPAAVWLSC